MSEFPSLNRSTGAGTTGSFAAFRDDEVFAGKRVTMDAMGFPLSNLPGFAFSVITTRTVHPVRYSFEVPWINAGPVSTEMIEFGPIWDRSLEFSVGVAVSEDIPLWSTDARTEPPVSIGLLEAEPDPAVGSLLNLGPETVLRKFHSLSVTHREE